MGPDRAAVENRVLNRIIDVIFSSTKLDEVLSATPALVLEATAGDACFIHLVEPDGSLVLRAASDPYSDMVGRLCLNAGEGIAGWVAQNRESVVIRDGKRSDPRYKYIPELEGERYTSLMSVCLVSPADRLIGAVNVHTKERRDFTSEDVAFLEHVGSLIAAAIEHARLMRELGRKETALQGIIQRTIQAQEDERRRVATEIHDGVTQQLISIWYRLNACESLMKRDPKGAGKELEMAKQLVDEALNEARTAIYQLRPTTLDDLGLVPAIEALASRTFDQGVEFSVAADIRADIPPHLETAMYRIAQEAMNNIRKHSGATRVEVTLENDPPNELLMHVSDDGEGFDLEGYMTARPDTSFGLLGISERVDLIGGRFHIESAKGSGTRIEVRVPLQPVVAGSDAA